MNIQIDEKYLINGRRSGRLETIFGTATIDGNGYFKISSTTSKYYGILLHRLIFEAEFGVKLNGDVIIHHKDENKLNNLIDNLVPMNRANHNKLHHKNKKVSLKTREKMSKIMTGKKHSDEGKLNSSKVKNTSGYFRVSKKQCPNCKNGFMWRYTYNEDGKQKQLAATDLKKLREKVLAKGLLWQKIEREDSGSAAYDEIYNILSKYFGPECHGVKECADEIYKKFG